MRWRAGRLCWMITLFTKWFSDTLTGHWTCWTFSHQVSYLNSHLIEFCRTMQLHLFSRDRKGGRRERAPPIMNNFKRYPRCALPWTVIQCIPRVLNSSKSCVWEELLWERRHFDLSPRHTNTTAIVQHRWIWQVLDLRLSDYVEFSRYSLYTAYMRSWANVD